MSLRIPEELEARLDEEGRRQGLSRSEVVRDALEEFLARKERERIVTSFVAEARAVYGDPALRDEALAFAAEALATDNETLEASEAPARRPPASVRGRRRAGK